MSLSLASLLTLSTLPGCGKLEELTGGKEEEAKTEEAKSDGGGEEAKADGGEEAKADGGQPEQVADATPAPVEPIPVEPMLNGLDLMLKLVPDGAEFVIARDATVVADYVDEATRFLDGPLATLETGPFAGERELRDGKDAFDELKGKTDKIKGALDTSGIDLAQGAAMIKAQGGGELIVYHAADPAALPNLGKTVGESELAELKCKAIEGVEGFNVCADSQGMVDGYAPSSDPAALRSALSENLPGVLLDDANLLAHVEEGESDETWMAISTIPGQFHIAVNQPNDTEIMEVMKGMEPGPANTLASAQPGAGFVWARMSKALMDDAMTGAKGTPVEAVSGSFTGEFVLAGSVDPGGIILQAGTTDTAGVEGLLAMGFDMAKDQVPKAIPELPGATLAFEKLPITGGGKTAQALHIGVSGLSEAEVLRSYTGLNLDAWIFAANDAVTLAVGPNAESVGRLLDVGAGGPAQATLDSLPTALADGLGRNEVGMIVHMPMDFLHGAQMHSLVKAALKEVPEAQPEQLLALTSLLAPFSSATMWISKPGERPVVHIAVQSIGNRATDEGRAALDAAHTVADGGDPAVAFTSLATAYAASPMAWAYKTRAGTEGPGYMVGSGVGAALAVAAVAVPIALGKSNAALADDLGVKPEDPPEPEVKPTSAPKRPVTEPKPKKDPKTTLDPKTEDPKTEDPKQPIVEPKPLPPVPTKDPEDPEKRPGRRIGGRTGKGDAG
ncbi:MAG: hypothetical protein H6712_15995 [Myxococcales bacterium]|nr:hypothetical protein [Myxococcales bacterium]MCB9715370.1 hypothetical protein [Myxococcales bacterium]